MNNDATENLIEDARRAGAAYLRSLDNDLKAACADLRRRARDEGRRIVTGTAKPPHPWQTASAERAKAAG